MNDDQETPVYRPLGDGLALRTAADDRDVERVAELNAIVHGPGVGAMARELIRHYPGMTARDVFFVEDERTGEAVSTLMLIPWTLNYAGIPLPAGEMGLVCTLAPYRRRGLVRAQVACFKERLHERGCVLSHIQGIPYYYRQFGYEYAVPLEGGLRLTGGDLSFKDPWSPPGAPFTFRLAAPNDAPLLARLYDEAAASLDLSAGRSLDRWQYILAHTDGTEMESETWLVFGPEGGPAGYFRLPAHHFREELAVNETSQLTYDAALAVLHQAVALAPGVRLNLPASSTLMRAASALGAQDLGTYAWQIHIPDMAALLRAIAPALEARIAASPFAGLTRQAHLCFYRESVRLSFVAGRLTDVTQAGPAEGEINFPPQAFVPLALGYRSLEELHRAYPDVHVEPGWRLLVETLFPPMASFFYSPY